MTGRIFRYDFRVFRSLAATEAKAKLEASKHFSLPKPGVWVERESTGIVSTSSGEPEFNWHRLEPCHHVRRVGMVGIHRCKRPAIPERNFWCAQHATKGGY